MSAVRVVSRACPECGQVMDARPGLGLFTCRACPTAVDFSLGYGHRLVTCRPDEAGGDARLAFFLFLVDDGSGRCAHWIPAFRAGSPSGRANDIGERLSLGVRYNPHLLSAPHGAPVGRDRKGAEALLRLRLGTAASLAEPIEPPRLVSLPCRIEGKNVREPVTGWKWRLEHLWPSDTASEAPPVDASAAVQKRLVDRDARHAREHGAFRSFEWIRKFMSD